MGKDLRIETLRGIACILLVTFHAVGSNATEGMRVPDSSWLRHLNDSLSYIRMPIFTFLSGYVYSLRPVEWSGSAEFVYKKFLRLIVPMLAVGTLYVLIQNAVPGANNSFSLATLYSLLPVAHFWFVAALFSLFLIIVPLELLGILRSQRGFLCTLAVACVIFLSHWYPSPYLSLNGAIYLAPFFLAGYAMRTFDALQWPKLAKIGVLMLAVAAVMTSQLSLSGLLDMQLQKRSLISLGTGLSVCCTLYFIGFTSRALAWVGAYSFTIYLFHVFGTAGTRIILEQVGGFSNQYLLLALSIVAGLSFPVLLELILGKYRLPSLLLFGNSPAVKPRIRHELETENEKTT